MNFGFNLKILERGDLLPISKIPNLHIFLPTSVNDDLGLMCLKNKPNFKYKLHPSLEDRSPDDKSPDDSSLGISSPDVSNPDISGKKSFQGA